MKLPKPLYDRLEAAIRARLETHPELPTFYKKANLTHARFRWDMFAASGLSREIYDSDRNLYDTHIDTALRRIVPPYPTKGE